MKAIDIIKLATKGIKPSNIKRINEKGIDTDQIIKLSDAGYSVNDIDDLIDMIENTGTDATDSPDPANEQQNPDNTTVDKKDEVHTDNSDKKETSKEVDELKKQLATVQNQLASKDLSGGKVESPEDNFKEALRNLI